MSSSDIMPPGVSIVIPACNAGQFIAEAIDSVLAQTFTDFEVIVVDDGSTDDTREVVARFTDHRLRYVYQDHAGVSAARNAGIRQAQGRYIAFLDADDWWLPHKLALQVQILDACSEVGLVYCGAYRVRNGRVISKFRARYRGDVFKPLLVRGNEKVMAGSASAVIIRKECFEQVGGFDEECFAAEDWEMWLRLAARYEFDCVPDCLVAVRFHEENTSAKAERMRQGISITFRKIFENPALQHKIEPIKERAKSQEYLLLGVYHYRAGDIRAARRHFIETLRLNPFCRGAWLYLAGTLLGRESAGLVESVREHLRLLAEGK
jgi:glycosyltransferase involved in cell wall biosynthesis